MPRAAWKCLLSVACLAAVARAGPPFVTDDPEPVEYRHWEIYLASQTEHSPDGVSGTLPHLEVNYGVVPDVQLHLIVPAAFGPGPDGPRTHGLGDTEAGFKYRLLKESDSAPEIGLFPLAELPTGSSARGLGSGHTQLFLPLWLQKSFGKWTSYGGGGYWVNPGPGNRNHWFTGILVQREVVKNLAVGAEIFHDTPAAEGESSLVQANLGFTWDLSDHEHVLASAGPVLHGPKGYQTYLALQFTFGPEK